MVDETDQPHAPVDEVDNALETLVRNATEEFGFAPRVCVCVSFYYTPFSAKPEEFKKLSSTQLNYK